LLAARLKAKQVKFIVEPHLRFQGKPGEQVWWIIWFVPCIYWIKHPIQISVMFCYHVSSGQCSSKILPTTILNSKRWQLRKICSLGTTCKIRSDCNLIPMNRLDYISRRHNLTWCHDRCCLDFSSN
jgi:hypothetical protein